MPNQPIKIGLHSVLLGDELGQIKLVQLDPLHNQHDHLDNFESSPIHHNDNHPTRDDQQYLTLNNHNLSHHHRNHRHRIVRILDNCLQQEPAASRAITNIRPIGSIHESCLDTTEKPNNLFLVTNKVGQLFICNTNAIRDRLKDCTDYEIKLSGARENKNSRLCSLDGQIDEEVDNGYLDDELSASPMLSPVYYNMNSKVPVCGAQPINQTNVLVVYRNGDIQHVNIGQDVLQSSLKIKRKAIRMLGLGYNSDAKAIHWRIDGSNGICYFDTDAAASAHMNENDPLIDIVLSSPTHKLNQSSNNQRDKSSLSSSQQNLYNKSPCIKSRKYNEQDRLIPTQVINMISAHSNNEQYKPTSRLCRWTSITSLNLIYKKLALYDLVGSENFEKYSNLPDYYVNNYKLTDNRLAVGGNKYTLRVYDVQTQKAIYNAKTGSSKNPLACSPRGEPLSMVGDFDWLGGNKTTKKSPNMLATCSGIDSVVKVFDLRSPKPVFYIDLTNYTENKWQPYENHPRGCMFTRICASGAPYSTAVPSQQLAVGSTNGQLHIIDLRFIAKSHRTLGKLAGFCGGSIREIRFVSESFEMSKMVSCATDRFVRIHKIQTSFTSVVSQKLSTKVFLGTKPTCIQPVCDEITSSYLSSVLSRCGSDTHISTIDSANWSIF